MISGALAWSCLRQGPSTYRVIFFLLVPKCIIAIDITTAEFSHLFCHICEEVRKSSRKGPVEATKPVSTYKNSRPKIILHSWRERRNQCYHNELESCRDGDSHHIPI